MNAVDGRCRSLTSVRLCVDPGRLTEECHVSAPIMDLILRLTKPCALNPNPENTFPVWWMFVLSAGSPKERYCAAKFIQHVLLTSENNEAMSHKCCCAEYQHNYNR